MYQYFSINIIFSILVFIYLYLLKTAPFRVRFRLVMIGLISWIIPYDLINSYIPQGQNFVISTTVSNFNGAIKSAIVSQVENYTLMTLMNFMIALMTIGLIMFLKDITALKVNLKNLNSQSILFRNDKEATIYSVKNSDCVFSTGLINPKIYIAEKLINSPHIDSILKHELQHIKTKDQYWLLLITLTQRVFWWNPVVYLLAIKARNLLELSCDEACNTQKQGNKYQQDLAQLLVSKHKKVYPLASHFFGKSKLNIYRIRQLSREYSMNKKNKLLLLSTAFTPFLLILLVCTSPVSSEAFIDNDKIEEYVLAKNEIDLTFEYTLWPNNKKNFIYSSTKGDMFKGRMIVESNKTRVMDSAELPFKFEFTPNITSNDLLLFNSKITFQLKGKEVIHEPTILVENNKEAKIEINGDGYKFEIEVLPRF